MDRQAQRYIRRKLNCWQFAEEFGSKNVVNDCLVCFDSRPIAHRLTVESEFEGAVVRVRCPFERIISEVLPNRIEVIRNRKVVSSLPVYLSVFQSIKFAIS